MITSAVNPPDGSSCTGIVAPTILTLSSVATVLALKAIAATRDKCNISSRSQQSLDSVIQDIHDEFPIKKENDLS